MVCDKIVKECAGVSWCVVVCDKIVKECAVLCWCGSVCDGSEVGIMTVNSVNPDSCKAQ